MYTTLQQLKDADACVPGYTRMMAFFGPGAAIKDVKLPLAMIALVGDAGDAEWAADNSLEIDAEQYERLRRAHLVPVLKSIFFKHAGNSSTSRTAKRFGIIDEAVNAMLDIETYEDATAWIDKYSMYSYEHYIWLRVLQEPALRVPRNFIGYLTTSYDLEYSQIYRRAAAKHLAAKKAQAVVAVAESEATLKRTVEDPEAKEDDELDEPVSRRYAKRAAARVTDPMIPPGRWFPYDRKRTRGYNLARVLCCGDDPYQLVLETVMKHQMLDTTRLKGKGMMLSRAGDHKFHLTMNLSNPEQIWRAMHMAAAQSVEINDLLGVNQLASSMESALERHSRSVANDIYQITSVTTNDAGELRVEVEEELEEEDDDA